MTLRVLEYYLTVVREESITKAAEALHVTQPTLSRQLSQMEEELSVRLFDRGARKIRLTKEGLLLKRRAEEILELVGKTEAELTAGVTHLEGRISIGCGELAAVMTVAEAMRGFRERYPRVCFDLFTATADVVRDRMDRGLLDIGVLLEPIEMHDYNFIRLRDAERWVALLRCDDPLAEKDAVGAADLLTGPLILPYRGVVQSELASWFGASFDTARTAFTINLSTNAALLVKAGLGRSLVVEGSVPFWNTESITYRPLDPPLFANSVIAWKRDQPFSPAATAFLDHLRCLLGMTEA